jgi:serine/threonine protein kinase
MVQDYVAGENLEDYMERVKQPMPEMEALTYTSQVLDILQYLAQKQPPIVHRDIKPANIIICTQEGSQDKMAYLVDFGIARTDEAKQAKRKQTSALGTPGYAPPEQYQGNADARSDLYALAATLHFLLTNRDPRDEPPFKYPRVRTLNPNLSLETERVLDRALIMDITQRYQDAVTMKQDIDTILAHNFQVSGERSIYLRGSGTLAASRLGASSASPVQPERSGGPISPLPPSYAEGLRSMPSSEAARPRRPISMDSWRDGPSSDAYEWPQMQESRQRQQQQMYMPPMQDKTLSENRRFLLQSFIFLLVTVALIAVYLIFLGFR